MMTSLLPESYSLTIRGDHGHAPRKVSLAARLENAQDDRRSSIRIGEGSKSKNDDTGRRGRSISSQVAQPAIERDQDPPFQSGQVEDGDIIRADHLPVMDIDNIMTRPFEAIFQTRRKIFIKEETQCLSGSIDRLADLAPRETNASEHLLLREPVFRRDFLGGHAASELVEDQIHGYACARHNRRAAHDLEVDIDSLSDLSHREKLYHTTLRALNNGFGYPASTISIVPGFR